MSDPKKCVREEVASQTTDSSREQTAETLSQVIS
jgi:hypothetical protein